MATAIDVETQGAPMSWLIDDANVRTERLATVNRRGSIR